MKNHTDLLNLIAAHIKAELYVEIGVSKPENNFDKINVGLKIGVDPEPAANATCKLASDNFFEVFKITQGKTDLIGGGVDLFWIDGLHHADQVKRDILNAWDILTVGGVIAIHDCNPHSERITHVPRDSKEWCGDVYQVCSNIAHGSKITVDFDYGCCILRKQSIDDKLIVLDRKISWQDFDKNRQYYLNLISPDVAAEQYFGAKVPVI